MYNRAYVAGMLLAALVLLPAAPAAAIDGEVLITHAKALAGNITPGDTADYPVTLSLPGSYKFASNLAVTAGKHGILVASHDVTIDFAGFRLWSGASAINGIVGYFNSLTIKNGTIANFRGNGIHGTGHFWSIENMRITVNGGYGIYSEGRSWSIANSQIVENDNIGINNPSAAATSFLFRNNVVNGNGGNGLYASSGHIEGNIFSGNQGSGVSLGSGTILGNTFLSNTSYGIIARGEVGYGNNTLQGNNGASPEVQGGFQLHPNTCNGAAC